MFEPDRMNNDAGDADTAAGGVTGGGGDAAGGTTAGGGDPAV